MAMIKCPSCGQEISDRVYSCIYCGAQITESGQMTSSEQQSKQAAMNNEEGDNNAGSILDTLNSTFDGILPNNTMKPARYEKHDNSNNNNNSPVVLLIVAACMLLLMGVCGTTLTSCSGYTGTASVTTDDGKIAVPKSSSYFYNENYQDVQKIFEGAGFTNIKYEILDDLVTGWLTSDGSVEKVSVGGYTTFSTSDRFSPDTEVIITYHTFPLSESEKAAQASAEALQNISSETLNAIVGTYVGQNGSGLILYPDGSADYYWKDWDAAESGNTWSYSEGTLSVFIPKMYGITANVNATAAIGEGNTDSFVLSSDSWSWDDEEYVKVSDNATALSKAEYDDLISGNSDAEVQSTSQNREYECCGVVFELPSYLREEDTSYSEADMFIGDHCGLVFISGKGAGVSDSQFQSQAATATKNFIDLLKLDSDSYAVTNESAITIAGQPAYLVEFEGTYIGINGFGSAFLVCHDGDLIASIAVFEEGAHGLSCKTDVYQMLEHAQVPGETAAGSSVQSSSTASDSMTTSQRNAVQAAQDYLSFMAFSRQGLIEQLSSAYGDGYSVADATYAVDYLEQHNLVNWNEQAKRSAEGYLSFMSFSRQEMIEQLTSDYGEGFTQSQAEYAVNALGY